MQSKDGVRTVGGRRRDKWVDRKSKQSRGSASGGKDKRDKTRFAHHGVLDALDRLQQDGGRGCGRSMMMLGRVSQVVAKGLGRLLRDDVGGARASTAAREVAALLVVVVLLGLVLLLMQRQLAKGVLVQLVLVQRLLVVVRLGGGGRSRAAGRHVRVRVKIRGGA